MTTGDLIGLWATAADSAEVCGWCDYLG